MEFYGIDLGTSNCIVAKLLQDMDGNFIVKCLIDEEGSDSFPSVIAFNDEKHYIIGNAAQSHLLNRPDSVVELVKVRLGKTDVIQLVTESGSFQKSPQEISAYLLNHISGAFEQVRNAAITVPAFFDQSQKDATMQAGQIANITPDFLIEEPTAAIMFHIFSEYQASGFDFFEGNQLKRILVFDFGGGTLDLSLIEISLQDRTIIPKVIAIGGDTELGGSLIDFIFTRLILQRLKMSYPEDVFITEAEKAFSGYYTSYIQGNTYRPEEAISKEVRQFLFRLKRNLEQIKISLSSSDKATILFERHYAPMEITRKQFEDHVLMSEDLNIIERIGVALEDISKKRYRLNEVLLVGGSSQIPMIRDIIIKTFAEMGITDQRIRLSRDFSCAVAKGAAIQAALFKGVSIPPFMLNKCESIVARDIEIEHAGKRSNFIKKGTAYPFDERKAFTLKIGHSLSESVSLKLTEVVTNGVQQSIRQEICDFSFYLPFYYTNDDITLLMNIDEAGLYQIEAIHKSTGEAVEFEPKKKHSLSNSQLIVAKATASDMKDITRRTVSKT